MLLKFSCNSYRDITSKWAMSRNIYPTDVYPTFCHGGMTILSYQLMSTIYRTSQITQYSEFHLEDVLIYGILRFKSGIDGERVVSIGNGGKFHGKYRHIEKLVRHVAHAPKIQTVQTLSWRRSRAGMRMATLDPLRGKHPNATHFNASCIHRLPTMQGRQ